ncbi:hypothetical protein RB195_024866 [Necator americanus]|uniref:Uncharacterized protein n=1 Tax=Necator americanus TaxID=51031 RepID=A0ABR1EPW7_NECAM
MKRLPNISSQGCMLTLVLNGIILQCECSLWFGMRQMGPPSQTSAQLPAPTQTQAVNAVPSPLEFRIHEMNRRLYIFNSSGNLKEKLFITLYTEA